MNASRHEPVAGPPDRVRREAQARAEAEVEAAAIAGRYARRPTLDPRYDRLNPSALQAAQSLERAMARMLRRHGPFDRAEAHAAELGCGRGDQLLALLQLGFRAEHLRGLELLPERADAARERVPTALRVDTGDALAADIAPGSQDLLLQFTVFSSVLDAAVRQQLAQAMWRWLKPGGAVLWYDFTVDNPRNPDVRGVPRRELDTLFPQAHIDARRVTLAPPLARPLARLHPGLLPWFDALPFLRTHLLAWIAKPR